MDDYVHMRCLYCGKELALFKRLRGGEFCSDGHRQRYQEEYTQLALNRLLHANPPPEQESAPLAPTTANNPQPVEAAVLQGAPAQTEMPSQTAVLDPLPAPAAAPLPVFAAQTLPVEEPAPADMSTFLVEFPVPVVFEAAAHADPATSVTPTPGLSLPHLQEFPPETTEIHLDLAGRLPLWWLRIADFQTPLQERGLELREFVRGVPKVEIRLRPAGQTGLEPER